MITSKRRLSLCILFSLSTFLMPLHGESFRTSSLHEYKAVLAPAGISPAPVCIGVNDALEITWPRDNPFIKGLEIEIKIPKIVASYRDSEVLYLFSNVSADPNGDSYDYVGSRLYKGLLPSRLSYTFRIPFEGRSFSDHSPYAAELPLTIPSDLENLVLRTQLAMKGVPDTFFEAEFEILVQPVVEDAGIIHIDLQYPPESDLTDYSLPLCYIDDQPVDVSEPLLLKTGIHYLSIISEQFRNEMRTFSVEKAAESYMKIALQPITTDIVIQAPDGTAVYLDNIPAESHIVIPVEPGEHYITFSIGGYEVTKPVTVIRGRSYTISLGIDISIFEQE